MGGGVHQLNNNQLFNLQLFADSALNYSKVDNPYEFYLNNPTWTKGDIKEVYDLGEYYEKIPNYDRITTLPEENAKYIKDALPNVTSCYFMLSGCEELTSIDTTGWNTSNVTDMTCMFNNCNSLTSLDTSNWDTSNVTSMSYMFSGCYALINLDVSNWDTSNVTKMNRMFGGCKELINLDLSKWNTSNITSMGGMFSGCSSLTTIKGVIDMKSCTSYDYMFYACDNLTGVKIKNPPSGFTNDYASEISSGKIVIVQ